MTRPRNTNLPFAFGVPSLFRECALLLLLTGCYQSPEKPAIVSPGDYTYAKRYISWLIEKEMKKYGVQGLSIALVVEQQVIWAEGFGYADVARKIPATPDTIFRQASVSKLITAVAVMQLVEAGSVDLDRPLGSYLPEFSVKKHFSEAEPITPRNILTHHSGLPTDLLKGKLARNPDSIKSLIKAIHDEYTAFPPDTVFHYSNLAYCLLGCMVETLSGRDFVAYMDESVLRPMGMSHASFGPRADTDAWLSQGYHEGKKTETGLLRDLPAGSLYASVMDMSRFFQMIFSGGQVDGQQILTRESVAAMLSPQNEDVALDFDFRMGLAWFLGGWGLEYAGTVAYHSGALGPFRSGVIILPEQKIGLAVASNSSEAAPLLEKIAVEAVQLVLEAKTGLRPPEISVQPDAIRSLSEDDLESYSGDYATKIGWVKVFTKWGGLRARLLGKVFKLVPHENGRFSLRYMLFGVIPLNPNVLQGKELSFQQVEGHDVLVLHQQGLRELLGERITRIPIPKAWLERLGTYVIVNPNEDSQETDRATKIVLGCRDGLLINEITYPSLREFGIGETVSLPLSPVSDVEAVFFGLGGMAILGETLHAFEQDGEPWLRFSGYHLKRVDEDSTLK